MSDDEKQMQFESLQGMEAMMTLLMNATLMWENKGDV
jgi:hypothetical protein